MNLKHSGKSVSMPAGLAEGALLAVAATVTGSALIAWLVDAEMMDEGKIGYAVMVMLILASWLSSMRAYKRIKRRRALVCMAAGGIYMLLLLCTTALFFGGQYTAVLETALLVLCGSALACLPVTAGKGRRMKRTGIVNR